MGDRPEVVVHADLDGARHVFRYHGWAYDRQDDPVFESGMPNLLAFARRNGIRATLFVVASDLEDRDKRPWLERAVAEGHEIASHSLTHSDFGALDRAQKRREVVESRRRLEDELRTEVRGFRAPAFRIDPETVDLLADAGYAYDSSAFPTPAFARRLGLRELPPAPHPLRGGGSLMELPLPGHRPLPFPFHPSYGLVLGHRYFELGLRMAARRGLPLVLLFHLIDFAAPLPRDAAPGLKRRIYTLSHRGQADKLARCQAILDGVNRAFEITDTRSLLERHGGRPS